MRRNRPRVFLLPGLFLCSVCACGGGPREAPPEFRSFISRISYPVEYREITPFYENGQVERPPLLAKRAALDDVDMFEYLLGTSYSGLEYWERSGVRFEPLLDSLRSALEGRDTIPSDELERGLSAILKRIHDGHIALVGGRYNHAYRHKAVYFCDVLVERTGSGLLRVIDSELAAVKPGDLFTQGNAESFLFRTLSPPGESHYLIGALSFDAVARQRLSFNGRIVEIPFHKSRMLYARHDDAEPFSVERVRGIPVIRAATFSDGIYPAMKEFMNAGSEFRGEDTIVVNLLGNGGGSSAFPESFIRNLNGSAEWDLSYAVLTSPAIVQYYLRYDTSSVPEMSPELKHTIESNASKHERYRRSPARTWDFGSTRDRKVSGTYDGALIILTNRRILSAAEAMVGYSQSVKNRIVVGENTGGVAQFSDCQEYLLPNSRFVVKLPRRLLLVPGFEECVGFLPDYWLDSMDPLGEILRWASDPGSYRFEYACGFDEMLARNGFAPTLPADVRIEPPSPSVPENLRAFSGRWSGAAEGILDNVLVVEKIHDDLEVDAIYAWGVAFQWGIERPGWKRYHGTFRDGRLVLTDESHGVRISYELDSSGSLDGVYERPGIRSCTTLTRVMDAEASEGAR